MQHLEIARHNGVRTRNARLSAIHSFFQYAALLHPEHAALIQRVLAIPEKRFDTALVSYLTLPEIDALLASPDRSTWTGQRDYTLLVLAVQTGLRVSELVGLRRQDVELGVGEHIRCRSKVTKERCTPMTKTTAGAVRTWMRKHDGSIDDPLFPSHGTYRRLTRGAIWRMVANHAATASRSCSSLVAKHVTPHVLRHTAAMTLLHAGVDLATIALWLGHEQVETTQMYLHASLDMKERTLEKIDPYATPGTGRFRPDDQLLDFLNNL